MSARLRDCYNATYLGIYTNARIKSQSKTVFNTKKHTYLALTYYLYLELSVLHSCTEDYRTLKFSILVRLTIRNGTYVVHQETKICHYGMRYSGLC